jgi:hypothetical protein
MTMSRKFILGLITAASLGTVALAPVPASAHGSGGHSGGFAPHASAATMTGSKSAPVRFLGPPVQKGAHQHHFRRGLAVAYFAPGYLNDGCYVTRRVITPFGPRLRAFNVCGY